MHGRYPADTEDSNLNVITTLRERFPELVIGLSDHQNGIAMAVAAYMLGARVDREALHAEPRAKGTDHAFSLMPEGMRKLVRDLGACRRARRRRKRPLEIEAGPLEKMGEEARRRARPRAGHVLASDDIAIKSPADGGLPPYELDRIVGLGACGGRCAFDENVELDDVEPAAEPVAAHATQRS